MLKRHRRAANLTQEALAERAGISARSISDLERGLSRAPHPDTVAFLAEALNLTGAERAAFLAAAHPQPSATQPPLEVPLLPRVLSPLVAREREEAGLFHLLQRDSVRLLTLTGPAGVGKTRLALQVARTAEDFFADGVVFVSLAAIREPRLVALTIAQTLGLPESGQRQALQVLVTALRNRPLLLVLDNCEQVLGAADQVLELLSRCPELKVLATSRTRWRVRGEQTFPLAPLPVPDLSASFAPEELEHYGSVALFLQRVRALQPDFQLTAALAPTIAELCVRLDGLPLAIELAAARFPLLPPKAFLERLGDSAGPTALHVITGHMADLPERHQSLRAAIDWSYTLLSAAEQQLFRRLSVFAGGFSLEAALAVCAEAGEAEHHLLERLESLIAQSLIRRALQEDIRFTLLETIREYGLEQLAAAGEEPAQRERFTRYMLALAEQETQNLMGPEVISALERLHQETDNLRAALRWLQDQNQLEQALQLAGILWRFWFRQGAWTEGRDWLERLLTLAEERGNVQALTQAKAYYGAGVLAAEQGDYAQAMAQAEQCARLAEQLGEQQLQARAFNLRGNVAKYQGDFKKAAAQYEAGLALFRALQEQVSVAFMLNNLANLAQERGDYARARQLHEESLALKQSQGDQRGRAVALVNLGDIARDEGQLAEARRRAEEALALFEQLGDQKGMAMALNNLGEATLLQGDYERASEYIQKSLQRAEHMADQWTMAVALHNAGLLAWARGDAKEAEHLYHQSWQMYRREHSHLGMVECLEGLLVLYATSDPERGARLWGLTSIWRTRAQTPLPPVDVPPVEHATAIMRSTLGEQRFVQASDEGQTIAPEDALSV
jgi:predicted ATPase/DNA-binding XRE family transcriptional regulator